MTTSLPAVPPAARSATPAPSTRPTPAGGCLAPDRCSVNYALFLDYLQRYEQQHALTPGQVADWLQVASWAGRDDEVIRVWQRYGIYMPLPARAIACRCCRPVQKKPKAWPSALSLWKEALSLAPDNDDYRIGYVKTWPMPAEIASRFRKPGSWLRTTFPRTLRRSPMSGCAGEITGTGWRTCAR